MDGNGKDGRAAGGDSRAAIGAAVVSFLGIVFGSTLMVLGSFLTWRSDQVLGLFSLSGWRFSNIIAGDGKISLGLGAVTFVCLVVAGLGKNRVAYAVSFVASVAVAALALYELVYILTRAGIVVPGTGPYTLLGGGVVGILCSLGGFFMVAPSPQVSSGQSVE